jgi:hypothetical protein
VKSEGGGRDPLPSPRGWLSPGAFPATDTFIVPGGNGGAQTASVEREHHCSRRHPQLHHRNDRSLAHGCGFANEKRLRARSPHRKPRRTGTPSGRVYP